MFRLILSLVLFGSFFIDNLSFAQSDFYYTVGYSRSRAVGMGGAYTAVEQGIGAAFLNPATFHFFETAPGNKMAVLINPIASVGVWHYYSEQTDGNLSRDQWVDVAKVLPRALIIGTENWELGLVNHEELETGESFHPNVDALEAGGFIENHAEAVVVRLRLAKQVHLGGAVQYYHAFSQDSLRHGLGVSYGVVVLPHPKLNVGIFFVSLPAKMETIRKNYDRIEDESVNVGVAYHPFTMTTLALDVRNLTEEGSFNTREIHFGVEQGILGQLFLRCGYYYDREARRNRVTSGIGLLSLNLMNAEETRILKWRMIFDYGFLLEPASGNAIRRHFFTLNLGVAW